VEVVHLRFFVKRHLDTRDRHPVFGCYLIHLRVLSQYPFALKRLLLKKLGRAGKSTTSVSPKNLQDNSKVARAWDVLYSATAGNGHAVIKIAQAA
jgi:hypothetical protein